jgi:uncharacterized protein
MLIYDLAPLTRGPIATDAELAATDPLFHDLDVSLDRPVSVRGRLTASGPGRYYWQAVLATAFTVSCRRCLVPVHVPVEARVAVLFAEGAAEDDPSIYPIPRHAQELDLAGAVREELILALPEYVLCSESCRGLCPRCGADRNTGECACRPEADPRWAALETLRAVLPPDER